VEYVKTGDLHHLEKTAEEAIRDGSYQEHLLDLALWAPPKLLLPAARRLLAVVRRW